MTAKKGYKILDGVNQTIECPNSLHTCPTKGSRGMGMMALFPNLSLPLARRADGRQ